MEAEQLKHDYQPGLHDADELVNIASDHSDNMESGWSLLRLSSIWFDLAGFGGDIESHDNDTESGEEDKRKVINDSTPLLPRVEDIIAGVVINTHKPQEQKDKKRKKKKGKDSVDKGEGDTRKDEEDSDEEEPKVLGSKKKEDKVHTNVSDSEDTSNDVDSSDWDSEEEVHDEDEHLFFSAQERDMVYRRYHEEVDQNQVTEALDRAYSNNLAESNIMTSNLTLSRRKQSEEPYRESTTKVSFTTSTSSTKRSSPNKSSNPMQGNSYDHSGSCYCGEFHPTKISSSQSSTKFRTPFTWLVYRVVIGVLISLYGVFGYFYARDVPGRTLLVISNIITSLLAAACLYLGVLVARGGSMKLLVRSTLANEASFKVNGGKLRLERKFRYLLSQVLAAGLLLAIWGCIADQSAIEDLSVFSSEGSNQIQPKERLFIHDGFFGKDLNRNDDDNPLTRLLEAELELEADLDEDSRGLNATKKANAYSMQLAKLRNGKQKQAKVRKIPLWLNILWRLSGMVVNLIIPSCIAICCSYIAILRVRVRSAARFIDIEGCSVDQAQKRLVDVEEVVEHVSNYIGLPLAAVLALITARFITLTMFIVTESPSRYVENSIAARPSIMFNLVALPALVMAAALTSLGALRSECDFLFQVVNRFYVLNSSLGGRRSAKAEHLMEYCLTAALQPSLGGMWSPAPESAITVIFSAIMFYATMLKWKYRQFL